LDGSPVGGGHGGDVGVCVGGGGIVGLAVGGHRGGRVFVGVRGHAVWAVRPLLVAVVAALVIAFVAVVCAVRQLAVTAAAECLLVCGVMRFG